MKIRPLQDRVLIRRREEDRVSEGGIVIPDTANNEKPTEGEVIEVGPGELMDDGARRPMEVQVGDKVLFGKYAGNEVKFKGDGEYVILKESDIMAVVSGS